MIKRKEFMLGAVAGLSIAVAATAGGVIDWPTANAEPIAGASGRLVPNAGAAGAAFAPPQGAPRSFADIFEQVAPAVVQIDVESRVQGGQRGVIQIPGLPPGFGIPIPEGQGGQDEEPQTALGAGSGFFISSDGYIVTNNHVVADAVEITVKLADERELEARVVGRDPDTDLAVIKVEGSDFPFVSFEENAQPRVGDWVIAVGNPFGLGGTATAGIVSAQGRNQLDATTPYTDYLQIDAAINRGNSGGPTFDIYGRVIGVNSAIISPGLTGGSVGIGFAIPAPIAKSITDRLMRGETIERGYLGVQIQTLTRQQREALRLSDDVKGAFVNSVTPGGPAADGGLQAGDIVVRLNGEVIDSSTELTRLVGDVQPGASLRMEILREGRRQTVTVRSGVRPAGLANLQETPGGASPGDGPRQAPGGENVEGLLVSPVSGASRERYDLPAGLQGLVITGTAPGSRAARVGFEPGMVILQANGRSVRGADDLRAAVQAAREGSTPGVFLLVRTAAGNRTVIWPVDAAD